MDEQSGDNLTSSMVDYVFFVLQQSSQRAVGAHNIYGLCATINHIVKCLDINYKEVIFFLTSNFIILLWLANQHLRRF